LNSDKLIIFSFFSGAGFLDLGFENAGFEIGYVNEIHPPFLAAYKYARLKMDTASQILIHFKD
jgi:DNA (cytosine-5)-methyltransferase 1